MPRFLAVSIILFGFWLLLSWHFDPLHLTLGLISSLLIAYLSSDLLISEEEIGFSPRKVFSFILYSIYLAYNIVLANLDVAYRVLHPRMPIDPQIVEFKTKLRSDVGRTILANSITLTPGTISVDVRGDVFYVHALSEKSAEELLRGKMEGKLMRIFE
ncbi:MAG: Na+/H+ antiporter subunit E [Candidatus Altiarchaeota archaeon]|nr:Na+/H+ antiporter subunit E [Candidatus Altiarchaeota archaeon]